MTAKIVLEAIVYSLLYTGFMLGIFKVQGARKQLYNYPPAIQEQAIRRGITTQEEMDAIAKKNNPVGVLVMVLLCGIVICGINQERSFLAGFWQSYVFLNAFSLFDAAVIDSLWFCHSKWWVIHGTEDLTEAYHDYAFHWKWFFLGLGTTLPLAVLIGGIVALVGRFL